MNYKIKLYINIFLKKIFLFLINYKIFRFFFFSINRSVDDYFVSSKKTGLIFFCKNYLIKYRIDTLHSKEPETIEWIENFNKDDIFFDIGANIGLYSCYAAKKGIKTFSFEPSVFNLEILVKNININKLNNYITIVPISLYNKNIISNFNLQTLDHGGALSSFLEKYSYDGKSFDIAFYYQTPGVTLDTFVELFAIPQPNHIKIDVDGIEHLILQGSSKVIKKCNSILVEVNEEFEIQYNEVKRILHSNNFKLEKAFKASNEKTELLDKCYNQIWKNINN
jgi:FkbM family methyltransferase